MSGTASPEKMNSSPDKRHPVAVAMEWVSKITSVALEMIIPGLVGFWLDQRWGTQFLAPVGFIFGVSAGLWHLILLTRTVSPARKHGSNDGSRSFR